MNVGASNPARVVRYLDLDAFLATPLTRHPYDYVIVPGFVREDCREKINADYPRIPERGTYPVGSYPHGTGFQELLDELESREFRRAFEEKFQIDLTGRPTMITVRGQCAIEDGQIHTDSKKKIIAALIYMNSRWESADGRLRLLRSADNLDDMVAEVPPTWTLVAFRRAHNSWHGHRPFAGERRVVQLHWVTSELYRSTQILRHYKSALSKRMLGAISLGRWRIS